MKQTLPLTLALFAARALFAADVAPTNQVTDAITKLKAAPNYSWTSTLKIADSQFNIGPVKGQTDKDGYAKMSQDFNDNTTVVALKGDKTAYKTDTGWQLLGGAGGDMGSFMAGGMARNGAPAKEAEITLTDVKELKVMDDGSLGGDFTTNGAIDMMTFGPRQPAAANAFPPPKNVKGSVKFWIKDGMLTKFETHLHGTVTFGDETEMDQTRTVEIQDVGTTKMDIPTEAKTQLDAKTETK